MQTTARTPAPSRPGSQSAGRTPPPPCQRRRLHRPNRHSPDGLSLTGPELVPARSPASQRSEACDPAFCCHSRGRESQPLPRIFREIPGACSATPDLARLDQPTAATRRGVLCRFRNRHGVGSPGMHQAMLGDHAQDYRVLDPADQPRLNLRTDLFCSKRFISTRFVFWTIS